MNIDSQKELNNFVQSDPCMKFYINNQIKEQRYNNDIDKHIKLAKHENDTF